MPTDLLGHKTEERAPRAGWEVAEKGHKEGWARSPSTVLNLTGKLTMLIEEKFHSSVPPKLPNCAPQICDLLLNLNWMSFKNSPFTSAIEFSPVQFSGSAMSDSLQSHGLQHTRLPCPSIHHQILEFDRFSYRDSVQFRYFYISNHYTHLLLLLLTRSSQSWCPESKLSEYNWQNSCPWFLSSGFPDSWIVQEEGWKNTHLSIKS